MVALFFPSTFCLRCFLCCRCCCCCGQKGTYIPCIFISIWNCIHSFISIWIATHCIQATHTDPTLFHLWISAVALAHQMNARPLGINLMIYNRWNYKWTMNCNLPSQNLYSYTQQCRIINNNRSQTTRSLQVILKSKVFLLHLPLFPHSHSVFFFFFYKFFFPLNFESVIFRHGMILVKNCRQKSHSSAKSKWLMKFIHRFRLLTNFSIKIMRRRKNGDRLYVENMFLFVDKQRLCTLNSSLNCSDELNAISNPVQNKTA